MREQPKHPTAIAAITAIIIVVAVGGAVFFVGRQSRVTSKTVAIRQTSPDARVEGASITSIANNGGAAVTAPPKQQNKPKDKTPETPKPPIVLAASTLITPLIIPTTTPVLPGTDTPSGGDGSGTTPTPPTTPEPPVVTPPVVVPPVADPCKSGDKIIVKIGGVSCSYTVTSADGASVAWSLPTLASTLDGLFLTNTPTAPVQVVIETASTAGAGQPFTAASITFHFKALATATAGDYLDLSGLSFSYVGTVGLPIAVPGLPLTIVAPAPATTV